MPGLIQLLERLEAARTTRDEATSRMLPPLIRGLARRNYPGAATLIRLHETLLFLRAWPHSREVLREAESALRGFDKMVERYAASGGDMSPFEEPEASGIAGTSLSAVFSYETARRLTRRYRQIRIDWQYQEESAAPGRALPRFLPLLQEESLIEPHVPYQEYLRRASGPHTREIRWLMDQFDRWDAPFADKAEVYDSLGLLLGWDLGFSPATRTRVRKPGAKPFYHPRPLLRRTGVSLAAEIGGPALPVDRVGQMEGRRIIELALDTSAVRYRELHGFTFGDPAAVWRAQAGRGLEIYVIGVLREHRLPLRAYHSALFVKNGVPVGYFEGLSLFEHMETGFNLYYTFRDGETAWLFARTLRLLRQLLGVTCFTIDPYQIGHQNEEGIDSGAFWFYRKLGFQPTAHDQAVMVEREERRLASQPGYRTPPRLLRRLAGSPLIYEQPGAETGEWGRFRIRRLLLRVQGHDPEHALDQIRQTLGVRSLPRAARALALLSARIPTLGRWNREDKSLLINVMRAKASRDETLYLRLLRRHRKLRTALLVMGRLL